MALCSVLATDGTRYVVIHNFGYPGLDGCHPEAGLVQGTDGALYGTTREGGTHGTGFGGSGTVFKVSTNGTGYLVLHTFTGVGGDGSSPQAGLIQGADGMLCGTTWGGGVGYEGTVFKIGTDGNAFAVLYSFGTGQSWDGGIPRSTLLQLSDGMLYGTTESLGTNGWGTVFKLGTNGLGYTHVYDFDTENGDGYYPASGLVHGLDGALYGVTPRGGLFDWGTVFKVGTNGIGFSVVWDFNGFDNIGVTPARGLMQGRDGALYGATYSGGTYNNGSVFRLNGDGNGCNVSYSFSYAGGDGGHPLSPLLGHDGSLYGSTGLGGASNSGTIFKMSTSGSGQTALHDFAAELTQGRDGALYGPGNVGTHWSAGQFSKLLKLSTNGTDCTVLHTMTTNDGSQTSFPLMQHSDGMLYGATLDGGSNDAGTVFQLATDVTSYTILHSFRTNKTNGRYPEDLLQGRDGQLYGTTSQGGSNGAGTIFKVRPDGYTQIYSFDKTGVNAGPPYGRLSQGHDGGLYGTTLYGGTNRTGAVFR